MNVLKKALFLFLAPVAFGCAALDGDVERDQDKEDTINDFGVVRVENRGSRYICHPLVNSEQCDEIMEETQFVVNSDVSVLGDSIMIETETLVLVLPKGYSASVSASANLLGAVDFSVAAMKARIQGDTIGDQYLFGLDVDGVGTASWSSTEEEHCYSVSLSELTIVPCEPGSQQQFAVVDSYELEITPVVFENWGDFNEGTYELTVSLD